MDKVLINQAIEMIEQQDMGRWSDVHDNVTLRALRDYRTALASPILPFSDGGEGEKGAAGLMASDDAQPKGGA